MGVKYINKDRQIEIVGASSPTRIGLDILGGMIDKGMDGETYDWLKPAKVEGCDNLTVHNYCFLSWIDGLVVMENGGVKSIRG